MVLYPNFFLGRLFSAHSISLISFVVNFETIALCGTRCVIIDIQAPSFTRVNSLCLQSQCLAKAAFCKKTQKNK